MTAKAHEALACGHCDARFLDPDHLALHVGRRHDDATDEERAAFEAAAQRERAWLATFSRRMRAALAALAPLVVTLAVFLLIFLTGTPLWIGLLMIPPALGFAGLAYVMSSQE